MKNMPDAKWTPIPGYEQFVSPCSPPTPYERELLEILIEECAEVQQRATKMLRFGVEEVQPGQPLDNRTRLSEEVGDLMHMIDCCRDANLLSRDGIADGIKRKKTQLAKYMQTKPETKA